MPRELLMMQNSFEWEAREGQTLQLDNAIKSNARGLKIEGQTYQNLLSETKTLGNYTYDESTGEYTLTNPVVGEWNSMIIKYTRPVQANEKLLIRINFVKNTIESTQSPPVKITYCDSSSSSKGFINVNTGFTGLIEHYCDGAIVTDSFNTKIEISTRPYTSGELVIKDIQVIPVSENPIGSTELPTSINEIESVAEREKESIQNLYTEGDLNVKGKNAWLNTSKIISCKPNTNYTFSCNIESVNKGDYNAKPFIEVYTNEKLNPNKNITLDESGSASFTTNNEAKKLIIYFFVNTATYSSTECEANFKDIELYESDLYPVKLTNKGKNLLDLSTFTPVSTSDIQASISGNVITIKGSKTSNVESATDAKYCNLKVYLEEGKTYTASFKSDATAGKISGTDTVEIFLMLNGGTVQKFYEILGQSTFTIPEGCSGDYYIRFDVNSGDKTHKFWDIQVEEGSVVTDYEPYREPTLTEIPLPQPLRSLPNGVCDTIENGKLIQRVGKILLDGSRIYDGNYIVDSTITKRFSVRVYDMKVGYNNSYCDTFVLKNDDSDTVHYKLGLQPEMAFFHIPSKYNSNVLATQYFSENPTTLYYELTTPIEHTIEQPIISIAKGSNLISTANNIQPNLKLTYKKSKK